ncbi:hypothetical protein SOVF_181380 [Spinacia oleracea]|uniref:Fasciclin-like arabinogalactan protein 20 n=1 Tax=Spinacia oleracea TaxID=3562 RepID=A0A9R0IZ69_SPIOL|nr:putative fasciclin-like arabinogalactan protein 20 [Spinacia oleracea]KNA06408.1 hypothetical protein SOVF_181380 [Spinacia oleracea]
MAPVSIFSLLTLALFFPQSSAISDETVKNAAEILSDSGFNSMSLTLPFITQTLISAVPSATLFTPSDSSFSLSSSASSAAGQPSLSLLQFHFCPRYYSFVDLQSLSPAAEIPTLLPNKSLTITSSEFDDDVSIDGVKLNSSPIFDDGFFVIFQIERFFNPNLTVATTDLSPSPISNSPECAALSPRSSKYAEASASLRSSGYSVMAAFLDLQLTKFGDDNEKTLTIFAPTDSSMERHFGNNYSEWGSLFLRHVVGCELSWGDLIGQLDSGFVLPTFLKGFQINISRSNVHNSAYSLILNGEVAVDSPELYRNDGIVVHGLSGVLAAPTVKSGYNQRENGHSLADHIEF